MKNPATVGSPFLMRAVFCLALGHAGGAAHASGAALDFDTTFPAQGEARQLHFRASYPLGGQMHAVEVWRDRNLRLKRRTDDRIETFLFKPLGKVEWQMVVLDLKHQIRTDIDRTNLVRIGHFTDWFSQAHALSRPLGPYRLHHSAAPALEQKPVAACQWYRLQQGPSVSAICWSKQLHLPLLITDAEGKMQWQVTAVDRAPFAQGVFHIDDLGYVRNDANADIQTD